MKRWLVMMVMLLASSMLALGQQQASDNSQANAPTAQKPAPPAENPPPQGTTVKERETDTVVQPVPQPVRVTRQMVGAAQTELDKRGYDAGPADGVVGPRTRAAVSKFQADQGLPQTGRLDVTTMEKLNVGGLETLGAAPADMGRGGKAFGHDIKQGHPVAASKALGQGAAASGKKVAKGSESLAKKGAEKVGSGFSKIGGKIEGKSEGQPKNPPPDQNNQNPPPK